MHYREVGIANKPSVSAHANAIALRFSMTQRPDILESTTILIIPILPEKTVWSRNDRLQLTITLFLIISFYTLLGMTASIQNSG